MQLDSPPRPASAAVVLMYHALADGAHPAGQDPHYTLASQAFDRHLDCIAAAGGGGCARGWFEGQHAHAILLTFDDGHVSNHRIAFPALARRGMTADFFVNPAMVGTPGFASWGELREMSDAGMSIQSHGYDHVYLTSLSQQRLRETLRRAREEISERMGRQATLLAPPGGRMPHGLARVAQECGYVRVLSSRPGLVAAVGGHARPLPRMAMTTSVDDTTFGRWIGHERSAIAREQLRYASLATAKRLLGDRRYERARARALAIVRGSSA